MTPRRKFVLQSMAASVWPVLPVRRRSETPLRVTVLGAGLSGLAAAWELVQAGCDVTVLEARTRPGGRVFTLRGQLADDLYAEAGAVSVFDNHEAAIDYARQVGVALEPLRPVGATLFHLRGQRMLEPGPPVPLPFPLSEAEEGRSRTELWEKYAGGFMRSLDHSALEPPLPAEILALDGISFHDFLRRRGASSGAVSLLRLGIPDLAGGGIETTSALHVIRDLVHRLPRKQVFTIQGGSDRLPRALAARLGSRLRFGVEVGTIEQMNDQVRVGWPGGAIDSDRVICTLPLPALRAVSFIPALSAGKQRAVAEVPYSSVVRVFAQTRTPDEHLRSHASPAGFARPPRVVHRRRVRREALGPE